MFDVISIGSATLDILVKSPVLAKKPIAKQDYLTIPYGSKNEIDQLQINSGGGATNTAVGFSRLGLKAAVLSRCGWDFGGKLIRQELKKEKVDESLLIQLEKEETDLSVILISMEGESTVLVYRGKTRLEKSSIDLNKLNCRWFCISNLEGNLDLLTDLINFAGKNKIKVAINPGKREIERKDELLALTKNIDLLVINQEEAERVGGKPEEYCRKMTAVTMGEKGVRLFTSKGILVADGFKMEMVDTTGAGDAFFCGLVAGLVKGWQTEKALKLGIANGASAVTEIGAKPGLLRQEFIHNWLNKPLKMKWEK
jgi:sugar/nucleoside kinase (ribokinase family)